MKKFRVVLSIALLMIGMVGCAGAGDYEIELINGFKVMRTSAECVQVGHDNTRYIIAKTNLDNYYLLDTKEVIVHGPFTEEKFIQVKENAKISENVILKDLDEYEKVR